MLHATEVANRRAAVTGPQTGRARRGHQMTESWIAKQRRVLECLREEMGVLEEGLRESRREREEWGEKGENEGCGVM